jgi:hypothetical protein
LKGKKEDTLDRDTKKLPIEEGCLSKGSVIIYVWRQKDTEIVAEQLIGAGVGGGVVCYHGGMDANDRAKAQGKVCYMLRNHCPIRSCFQCIPFLISFYGAKLEYVLPLLVSETVIVASFVLPCIDFDFILKQHLVSESTSLILRVSSIYVCLQVLNTICKRLGELDVMDDWQERLLCHLLMRWFRGTHWLTRTDCLKASLV